VTDIQPNSPAAKAGLKDGDVIHTVDGKKITDSEQLRLVISQTTPGTKVTLTFLRSESGGKPAEETTAATLDTLPGEASATGQGNDEEGGGSNYDSLDGVEVADLNTDARQQYSIPNSVHGALVSSVDENSNSAEAGLVEGDVIQEINHQPVRNADDAVKLSDKAHGNKVLLRVWREDEDHGGSFYMTVDNLKRKQQ
jgi:serine protease Do